MLLNQLVSVKKLMNTVSRVGIISKMVHFALIIKLLLKEE